MSNQLKSGVSPIARIAISAPLFASLASLERAKGQKKLAEQEEKAIKAAFDADATAHTCENGEDCQWVTESGQLVASLKWQSRKTLSAEKLLAAGIPQALLDACTGESSFSVLRTH